MATTTEHRFDADTAVVPLGDGIYAATCSSDWGVPMGGPNGGYFAAILARAVLAEVDDPERRPRSLSVQFLRRPAYDVELRIAVAVERVGRTMTNVTVRAEQEGRLLAIGMAIAALDQTVALDYTTPAPVLPPPDDVPTLPVHPRMPPIASRYLCKPCLGPAMFSGGDEALTGGWIRLVDPRPFDALAAVAYLDAWLPAPFTMVASPLIAPTLDYTVHLRAPLPVPELDPAAFLMLRMGSTTSASGMFEEDCEIWSPDGVLLAQSRQLALLAPLSGQAARTAAAPTS